MPIAIETDAANAQHYEVPARFYDLCLGPCKKYSSGYWPSPDTTFAESEIAMLDLYCTRAGVQDGMHIVDLGCGWGSLTLHLAQKFPNAKITGISNSHSQREYILRTAKDRGLKVENITIITVSIIGFPGFVLYWDCRCRSFGAMTPTRQLTTHKRNAPLSSPFSPSSYCCPFFTVQRGRRQGCPGCGQGQ